MQTSTIEATWRGVDGHAQKGWYDIRLTHRLVNATGETILPAGRIAAGRLNEREDQPSLQIEVPAAGTDDTADWFLVAYVTFEELRTAETYVIEPVPAGETVDLALQVPVVGVPEGLGGGTVVRGIDGKDGRGIESVDLDGDALVFTYSDGTLEFVTVEGGFGGGGDTEPGKPGRGIESLTQVDETTLEVIFTDQTTQTLTLPRGEDGKDADPLTVDGYTFDEGGHTVVTFSDGSEAVVQRGADGEDGDDGADFTYADFTPEQLEALRGPRGYAGRGVESITDEDGDGVATVTYSDGETSDLPLPAGGGGGTQIVFVDELPADPDPDTLYITPEV